MSAKLSFPKQLVLRHFTSTIVQRTQCSSLDPAVLDNAIKKLYAEHVSVPVVIGNQMIFTGDEQNLRMPHNHRRITAKYYFATKNHINLAIEKALKVQDIWSCTDIKQRSDIYHKAANSLIESETQAELIAATMLSQAKTKVEAENDVNKLVLMLRTYADDLLQLSKLKVSSSSSDKNTKRSYLLRPLDGFVAVTGPVYTSWLPANMALAPLLMGNTVLWRPPQNSVLTSFLIFKTMIKAGLPRGSLQFLPSNYKLFLNTVVQSNDLAGINYGGRVTTLRNLWHDISIRLPHYKCFPRLVGECDSKGYHFVHESADVDLVVDSTVQAAFHYSGQRTFSCGRFYVPATLWPELCCQLLKKVDSIKIGDPTDENTYSSAIIREDIYDNVVSYLEYVKSNENVEFLKGGNYTKTHGYFIEPTIVVCKNPKDRLMIDEIMGPVLSVYVYDNNKLDDVLQTILNTQQFGSCGAIFSSDQQITEKLVNRLRMTASNLYVNEQCAAENLSHLPLSGNRLSGTNDKNGSAYYLMRFANPQIIEETMFGAAEYEENVENQNCSC